MPRINLLPWREQQRTERKKSFGVGIAAATVAALAVAGAGYLLFNSMIASQQARNARLGTEIKLLDKQIEDCLLYTSPSPRDRSVSRMPSSA